MIIFIVDVDVFEKCAGTISVKHLKLRAYLEENFVSVASFFTRLYLANVDSFNVHYEDSEEAVSLEFTTNLNYMFTPIQLYKQLQCINYQCQTISKDLKSGLNHAITLLSEDIISNLKEYKTAAWGC